MYPKDFELNITEHTITVTFNEDVRGQAYIIINKAFDWVDRRLIVADRRFAVTENPKDVNQYFIEIDTEYVEILKNGNTTLKSDVTIGGQLNVNGSTTFTGDQSLDGDVAIDGNLSATGTITSINNFFANMNANIDGDLHVKGNTVLDGNLTVKGITTSISTEEIKLDDNIVTLNSNAVGTPTENAGIEVSRGEAETKIIIQWQESTKSSNIPNYTIIDGDLLNKSNTIINGTLQVDLDTTLNSTLHTVGATQLDNDLTVDGNELIKTNLTVDGLTTLVSDTTINANLTVDKNINVNGTSNLVGNVTVDGDTLIKGNDTIEGDLLTQGDAVINGTLQVDGNTNIDGNLTISGTSGTNVEINTTTLTVEDNIITLNKGAIGTPTENVGIEADRGDEGVLPIIQFNEKDDYVSMAVKQSDGTFLQDEIAGKTYTLDEISKEHGRATSEESTLQSNIDTETNDRKSADDTLTKNLSDEITRAKDSESTLQSNIDTEISDRKSADDTLTKNLNDEITRAKDSESTLQSNIDTETNDRKSADDTLTTNLNDEITRAKDSEFTLQSNKVDKVSQLISDMIITTDTTAVVGTRYYVDVSAGEITITLPSPNNFDKILFHGLSGDFTTNNLTINADSNDTIMTSSDPLIVDTNNETFTLVFVNNDWRIL